MVGLARSLNANTRLIDFQGGGRPRGVLCEPLLSVKLVRKGENALHPYPVILPATLPVVPMFARLTAMGDSEDVGFICAGLGV